MDSIFDFLMEKMILPIIVMLVIVLVCFVPYMVYTTVRDSNAETFSLIKSQWVCTKSETRPVTTYIMVGKVMVPSTTYQKHCMQWSEK